MSGVLLNVGTITSSLGFNEVHKFSLECGEVKSSGESVVASHHESDSCFVLGTSNNCSLCIASFDIDCGEKPECVGPVSEYVLEFDSPIDALCFDPSGKCLIASDNQGYLHFVAVGDPCSLIFSHKTPVSAGSKLMLLKFYPNISTPASPLLVGVRDNGVYYSVNLPVAAVLKMAFNQPESLSTAVGKLAFASAQLGLPYPKRALVSLGVSEDASTCVNVFILDAYSHAHHAQVTVSGKTASVVFIAPLHGAATEVSMSSCVDVALLGPGGGVSDSSMPMLVLLGNGGEVCCFGAESAKFLFCVSLDLGSATGDCGPRIVAGAVRAVPESGNVEAFCVSLALQTAPSVSEATAINSYAAIVDPNVGAARLFLLHSGAPEPQTHGRICIPLGSYAGSSASSNYLRSQCGSASADESVTEFSVHRSSAKQALYLSALVVGFAAAAAPASIISEHLSGGGPSELHLAQLVGVCSNVGVLGGCEGGVDLVMHHLEALAGSCAGAVETVAGSFAVILELLLNFSGLFDASEDLARLIRQLKLSVAGYSPVVDSMSSGAAVDPRLRLGYSMYCYDTALKVSVDPAVYIACFRRMVQTSPMYLWEEYVREGSFDAAAVVRARHLHGVGFMAGSLLQSVAVTADSRLLLNWVRSDVVPHFFRNFNARGYQDAEMQSQLELAVQDLLRRAQLVEAAQKLPFEALQFCELAGQLASLVASPGVEGEEEENLSDQVGAIATLLELSSFMRRNYAGVPGSTTANRPDSTLKYSVYSLAELEDIGGLRGLVFQLFDSAGGQYHDDCTADSIASFELSAFLQRLCSEFAASYNDMCLQWIDDTVSNRVLALNDFGSSVTDLDSSYQSRISDATADGGGTPVALLHLMAVTCSIADPFLKAKAMLLLLQVPAGATAAAITARLYGIAEELLGVLGGTSLGDSLQEAVRGYKLASITSRYHITKLNLRDNRQVKAAAYVIAARWQQQYTDSTDASAPAEVHDLSIQDAVAFVTSRNAGGIELCTVLARGVLLRVLDFPASFSVPREFVVANALKQLPAHCLKVVVENVCNHLVQEMDTHVAWLAELEAGETYEGSGARAEEIRLDWLAACSGLITALSTYLDLSSLRPTGVSWCSMELLGLCKNLRALHADSGLVVSLKQIQDEEHCRSIVCGVAIKQAGVLATGAAARDKATPLQFLTTEQRRCCGILNVSCVYFLFELANGLIAKKEISLAIEVALAMNTEKRAAATAPVESRDVYRGGVLTSDGGNPASRRKQDLYRQHIARCKEEADLILSISTAFCMNSMKLATKDVGLITLFGTARELLKHLAINCPQRFVGSTMDYFVIADLVLAVHDRFDSQASTGAPPGDVLSILNGGLYVKDGILLSPSSVLMPLLKFCLKEIQRRSHAISSLHTGAPVPSSIVVAGAPPSPGAGTSPELMDLLSQLHKSENHVLAVRVLVTSWHMDCNKYSYVYASLKALTRKILTYREIDMELAVAYLGSIPDKSMVKELQSIIPTVQNDFKRLKLTALIGEQLALMWDKEDLLRVFQSLQNNAKWWSALSGYGIRVDTKTFQHPVGDIRSQYIRSIVPELLERSTMDLELAQDYCRQFDLTTEFANTCFIELILKSASTADIASETSVNSHKGWEKHVRFAASGVSPEQMVTTFRGVLKHVHEYSYDKIKFVCKWLVAYLQEESEVSGDYSKLLANANVNASGNSSEIKNKVPFGAAASAKAVVDVPEAGPAVDQEIVKEILLYQRYIDAIDRLTMLKIPAHVVCACSFYSGTDTATPSAGVDGAAIGSIPFWQLTDEPWGVLDSLLQGIMSNAAGVAGSAGAICETDLAVFNNSLALKVGSLCPLVLVDADAYHAKRIKLFYGKHRKQGAGGGDDAVLIGNIRDNMQFIRDVLCQTKLWLWMHEQETGAEAATEAGTETETGTGTAGTPREENKRHPARPVNSRLSQVALDHAVVLIRHLEGQTQEAQKAKKPRARGASTRSSKQAGEEDEDAELNLLIEIHQMKIDVQLLAVRAKCGAAVNRLVEASARLVGSGVVAEECATCLNNLYNYVHSPKDLLTVLYCSSLVEVAWILQLDCQNHFEGSSRVDSGCGSTQSNSMTVLELMHSGLCAATISFLHHCGRAVDEIQKVVALVEVATKVVKPKASSGATLSTSDAIRHAVVSKYLSEFHYSNVTNNATSGGGSGSGGVERLGGMVYSGASSIASFSSAGGAPSADSSVCTPTAAERRRGEDIFAGFCISVLICSCVDLNTRGAFVMQLENVIKDLKAVGSSSPSLGGSKRIASRSKFRSSLALRYIHNCAGSTAPDAAAMDQDVHMSLLQYLYCLCELQETRLGTPVDTLTQILLPQAQAVGEEQVVGLSARSVVNTWLYDEGENEDVLELCRDIYLASGCQDVAMWVQLLMKMFNNTQYHIMLTTLSVLSRHTFHVVGEAGAVQAENCAGFVSRLCADGGSEFVDSVLQMLASVAEETTTAIQQTFELFKYQKQQASSAPAGAAAKKVAVAEEEGGDYVPEVATVAQQRHVFSSLVPYFASVTPSPTAGQGQEGRLVTYPRGVNNLALDHVAVTLAQIGGMLAVVVDSLGGSSSETSAPALKQVASMYRQLLQWGLCGDPVEFARARCTEDKLVEGEQLLFALSWNASSLMSRGVVEALGLGVVTYCGQALRDATAVLKTPAGAATLWKLFAALCSEVASPADMALALDSVLLKSGEMPVLVLSALLAHCICHGGCTTSAKNRVASEVLISWCVQSLDTADDKKTLLKEALVAVVSAESKTGKVQLQQQLACVVDVLAVGRLSVTERQVLRGLLSVVK